MKKNHIVVRTADSLEEGETDWDRIDQLTDEEIEQAVQEDPDAVLLDEDWFERAELIMPSSGKEKISIRLDEDVIEWFKEQGPGYQTRMNLVLRAYMVGRRRKEETE